MFQQTNARINSAFTFRTGQIFYGTVERLFPNHHAQIRLGPQQMVAKIEVPLTVGKGYWLQVASLAGETKLKLFNRTAQAQGDAAILMTHLSLPNNAASTALMQLLMQEHYSLTKDEIVQAISLLDKINHHESGIEVLKWMINKRLPMTEDVFQSLLAAKKENTSLDFIQILRGLLRQESTIPPSGQKLLEIIESFFRKPTDDGSDVKPDAILQSIRKNAQTIGMHYESMLFKGDALENEVDRMLKPALMTYIKESNNIPAKSMAEQLINRINGHQIMSMNNGPFQVLLFEIPFDFFGFQTELFMQWEGKRTEKDTIDSDYCRILLYLELEHLHETLIDVNVQNRIMNIQIYNETKELQAIMDTFLPPLKSNLLEMGYKLSSVKVYKPKTSNNQPARNYPLQTNYSGVDIRI